MQIGIVGLPNSTKTTIFNALTRSEAQAAAYSTGQVETNVAVVPVPDARVDTLSGMFNPKKTTYARIQYNDIAGLRVGIGQDGGMTGPLLNAISQNDAVLHIVRAFEDGNIPHPEGTVHPARDLAALDLEFLFSDLAIIERRLERLDRDLNRRGAYDGRQTDQEDHDLLVRLKASLEEETPIRDLDLTLAEEKRIRGYQFLTAKPVQVVLNVGDEGNDDPSRYVEYDHKRSNVICLRGGLEMEMAQMEEDEAGEFMAMYEIEKRGLDRMIQLCYELLGLQSFFTVGEDEVRAWTIDRGALAPQAAGVIHSDLERGFIRAEVVAYDDMVATGTLVQARKQGKLRAEGREYVVQDGDVMNILFNI
jgi:ribosome-binding ATPase